MEKEKPKVVTIKTACEMLKCSRTWFNDRHIKNLTKYYKKNGRHVIFMLDDVEKYMKKLEEKKQNVLTEFEIVK